MLEDISTCRVLRKGRVHVSLTNKYSNYLLQVISIVVDYCAIICTERIVFELRNIFVS
jgi:hypothetical protein